MMSDFTFVWGRPSGPWHAERPGTFGRAWCGALMQYRHTRRPKPHVADEDNVSCKACLARLKRNQD